MAKFSYKGLTRGIRLAADQVWSPMQQILQAIRAVDLNSDNLAEKVAPFVLTFSAPFVVSSFSQSVSPGQQHGALMFPFVPFPTQDEFDAFGNARLYASKLSIAEVVISMDHAAESVGVSNESTHYLLESLSSKYTVQVTIAEKTPHMYGEYNNVPVKTVWSGTVDGAVFGTAMVNPFVWTDLSIPLNPYASYVAMIQFPNLYDDTLEPADPCVVSFVIELRGVSTLMKRDKGATAVQNIPTIQAGVPRTTIASFAEPVGGDLIVAGNSNVGGLDGAMRLLDYGLFRRLSGGYNQDSSLPPEEQISTNAAYDIIAVPMWAGFGESGVVHDGNATKLPFLTDVGTATGASVDRRLVPLPYPVTIQHVLVVTNYVAPQLSASPVTPPLRVGFQHQVSVSLGAGVRTDGFATQTVAELTFDERHPTTVVDLIKQCPHGVNNNLDYDQVIRAVPLVGTGGKGPFPQGKPIFAGRATSTTFARSPINGRTPSTAGCEQYLDIRWKMSDPAGMATNPDTVYAGTGGHWVLIYCKKHLIGGTAELDV